MRTFSSILVLVAAAVAGRSHAADGSDFVLRKSADGTHEFRMNGATEKSVESTTSVTSINQDSTTNASYLRAAGFLLVSAGIGMLLIWRHKKASSAQTENAHKMKVIERLALGARRELILVQACDRMLVIGSQGNQMMLLSDLAVDTEPVAAEFSQHVVAKAPAPAIDPEEEKSVLMRSLRVPVAHKVADTVAISQEARRRDWPEMQEAL
ncbi:MAG: flagellar biosynthetic protein FliO [Planctomycetota bacterium]